MWSNIDLTIVRMGRKGRMDRIGRIANLNSIEKSQGPYAQPFETYFLATGTSEKLPLIVWWIRPGGRVVDPWTTHFPSSSHWTQLPWISMQPPRTVKVPTKALGLHENEQAMAKAVAFFFEHAWLEAWRYMLRRIPRNQHMFGCFLFYPYNIILIQRWNSFFPFFWLESMELGPWNEMKWKEQVDWNLSCQDGPFGACNLSLQGKHSGLERRKHPFLCENWVCIKIQGPRIHECIDFSINNHSFCQCLFWGHYFWNAHLLFIFLPCFQVSLVLGETTEFFLRRAGDRSMVWDGTHEAQLLLWIHPIMRDC